MPEGRLTKHLHLGGRRNGDASMINTNAVELARPARPFELAKLAISPLISDTKCAEYLCMPAHHVPHLPFVSVV